MAQFMVDSEAVQLANVNIQGTITRLQQEVSTLHAQLQGLQGSWQGVAATSFQDVMSRWKITSDSVEAQLAEIGTALGHAANQYAEIEAANQRLFL